MSPRKLEGMENVKKIALKKKEEKRKQLYVIQEKKLRVLIIKVMIRVDFAD